LNSFDDLRKSGNSPKKRYSYQRTKSKNDGNIFKKSFNINSSPFKPHNSSFMTVEQSEKIIFGLPNTMGTCWFTNLLTIYLYSDRFYKLILQHACHNFEKHPSLFSMILFNMKRIQTNNFDEFIHSSDIVEELHQKDKETFYIHKFLCEGGCTESYIKPMFSDLTGKHCEVFKIQDGVLKVLNRKRYYFYHSTLGPRFLHMKFPINYPFPEKSIGKINELEKAIYGWFQEDNIKKLGNNIENKKNDNVDMISIVVKDEIAMPLVIRIPSLSNSNVDSSSFDEYVLDACSISFFMHILCCFTLNGEDVVHENSSYSEKSGSTLYHLVRRGVDEAISCPIIHFPWKNIVAQGTWKHLWKESFTEFDKNRAQRLSPCDLKHDVKNKNSNTADDIICFYVRKNIKTISRLHEKVNMCLENIKDFSDEQKIRVSKIESFANVNEKLKKPPVSLFSQLIQKIIKK